MLTTIGSQCSRRSRKCWTRESEERLAHAIRPNQISKMKRDTHTGRAARLGGGHPRCARSCVCARGADRAQHRRNGGLAARVRQRGESSAGKISHEPEWMDVSGSMCMQRRAQSEESKAGTKQQQRARALYTAATVDGSAENRVCISRGWRRPKAVDRRSNTNNSNKHRTNKRQQTAESELWKYYWTRIHNGGRAPLTGM